MAGEKITRILKSKTDLSAEDIAQMTDKEAWSWLYRHFPPKTKKYRKNVAEVCFTGFSASERLMLENEAREAHLEVVKTVTKKLRYLIVGPNAGPVKLHKALGQEVIVLELDKFRLMLETGELPI